MRFCYIGIGSNLGNRIKNLKVAINKISKLKGVKVIKISKFIETIPIGGPRNQPKFINAAIKIITTLSPLTLLTHLKKIEKQLGRKKTVINGPRIIDLDILLYSDKTINTKRLKVPHPRLFKRDFAMKPLAQIL
jgi:2-amino-4-hydroxy-6-hydroxymethyldihydropteridine diphosphokinase